MSLVHLLNESERKLFFTEAAIKSGIPFPIIEKDFWVVLTLECMFSIPEIKNYLTFKGGTSLSKVYGLIERFSEDVDLSIEKEFFGFGKDHAPEHESSRKKQKTSLEKLSKASADYIQNTLIGSLSSIIATKLGTDIGWTLSLDPIDSQTMQFEYPSITPPGGYIRPSVKIELGARSEHWPVAQHFIQSHLKETLGDVVTENPVSVKALMAERTFWEKATILHQYAHLPEEKNLPARLSRHYYDFYCLVHSPIKEKALSQIELLEKVALHKDVYFPSGWANYDTARKGTLKLLPLDRTLKNLEDDYIQMGSMFYRVRPEWEKILDTIRIFEKEFNQ